MYDVVRKDASSMAIYQALRVGGVHPETAALANILAEQGVVAPHSGRPFSEALLLGIGGGIGGGYFVFEFTGCPKALVIGARHQWHQTDLFLTGICERLGMPLTIRETTSAKAAATHLRAALDAGRRAIAWVDLAGLPYVQAPSDWERCWIHVAGVVGADDAAGELLLDDRGPVPWRIDAETFAAARAAIRSNKHRLMLVEAPPAAIELERAVVAGLRAGVDGLQDPPIKNFGIAAFEKWASLIADRKNKKGWPAVFRPGPDLLRALAATFHAVETNGTGGGALRPLFADFLDDAAGILRVPGLGDVAARYRELGAAWTAFAEAALPDAVPTLGETRHLLQEKERLTLARGADAIDDLSRINGRLRALEASAETAHPLSEPESLDLFAALRDRLEDIAREERAAVAELASAIDGL